MRVLCILILSFSLSGCFIIKDFGAYWDSGTIDGNLSGKWVSENDKGKVINFIPTDTHIAQKGTDNIMKTLELGEHKFMMLVSNNSKGNIGQRNQKKKSVNMLVNYEVKGDKFIIYSFNQKLYKKVQSQLGEESSEIKKGKISAVSVNNLTKEVVDGLSDIVKDRKYWIEFTVFKKVKS